MKIILKFLLTFISIIILLLLAVSINIRFQLLSARFWTDSFGKSTTYTALSELIKKNVLTSATSKGVRTGDVGILDDLISPKNIEDFVNNNITNLLYYANGRVKEPVVYLPIDKIPKSYISRELSGISTQIKLTDLLKGLNIKNISTDQINSFRYLGIESWILLYLLIAIYALVLFTLFKITDYGKRLVVPALALFIPGLLILALGIGGIFLATTINEAVVLPSNIQASLAVIILPPIMYKVFGLWVWIGGIAAASGLVLFFVRKGKYNRPK